MEHRVIVGDCIESMRTLPDASFNCCVTSPPYFGLRDYGHDGQIGLEQTPEEYVAKMVDVFREVRRVLRDDGTVWLNIGDSYAGSGKGAWSTTDVQKEVYVPSPGGLEASMPKIPPGLKPKDLIGIPWRLAFALQSDGWYLRQDIIWHKPNPMPESVTDRCTKAHEYVFLLTKSARYWYDAEAIKEPAEQSTIERCQYNRVSEKGRQGFEQGGNYVDPKHEAAHRQRQIESGTRNRRSVWTVATRPFSGAHFAVFPPELIKPCILAGCPETVCAECGMPWERETERTSMVIDRSSRTHELGRTRSSGTMVSPATCVTLGWNPTCQCAADTNPGTVLDPFGGSGTTALVAHELGRNSILCELNSEYAEMARGRIADATAQMRLPL